ncbi:MAG: hypothetical protein IJO40_03710 [Thermoguttaceae bacterium]|nr:hypothetical protein [Thermoguttaceae bacterium]
MGSYNLKKIVVAYSGSDERVVFSTCDYAPEPQVLYEEALRRKGEKEAFGLARYGRFECFYGGEPKGDPLDSFEEFKSLGDAIEAARAIRKEDGFGDVEPRWFYLFERRRDDWFILDLDASDAKLERLVEYLGNVGAGRRYSVTITERVERTVWLRAADVSEATRKAVELYEAGEFELNPPRVVDASVYGFRMDSRNDYAGESEEYSFGGDF